jgi:hypothetical protein
MGGTQRTLRYNPVNQMVSRTLSNDDYDLTGAEIVGLL